MEGSGLSSLRTPVVFGEEGTNEESAFRNGLTLRAFALGLVLCALMCMGLTYNRMVIQGSFMGGGGGAGGGGGMYMDRGALFVFFILLVLINPVLSIVKKRFALRRGELLAVYIMLMVVLPVWVMTKPVILYTTGVFYHGTPELRHIEVVRPYMLDWFTPLGAHTVRDLYLGLPKGGSIPWSAWIVPLWSWGSFLVVLFIVLIGLGVILRKQWEEHERFAFPILQVPLAMTETGRGRIGPLFKSRLMWGGFCFPVLVGTLGGLRYYFPKVPRVRLGTVIWLFRRTTLQSFKIHFLILGYSFFVNLDVSLSLWVFNLISRGVRGALAVVGGDLSWRGSGVVARFSSQGWEVLAFVGMGYILALTAHSLWIAREHFGQVWAKTLGRPSKLDDSEEVVPYRTAVLGVVLGLVYLGFWLYQAGISPPLVIFLLFSCFVVFILMARIVCETGFVGTYSPLNPSEFVVCSVGSAAFSPQGLVTLGVSYVWTMTRRNTLMGHALGGLRLSREIQQKRGLIWAMGAALALGLVATGYMTLKLGYTHGGVNIDYPWFLKVNDAASPFDEYIGRRLLEPSPIFHTGFWCTGLGMLIAAILMVLRARLPWWPLNPIALPLSTVWYMDWFGFNVFLAWGVKSLVLKFGGAELYRKTRPLFIGIILGEVMCSGVWGVVDYFTGMMRNWPYITIYWNV